MANIGGMIAGGFGLVARRPLSVVTWGLVLAVSGVAVGWSQLQLGVSGDLASTLDDAAQAEAHDFSVHLFALTVLLNFVSLLVSTIVSAAAFRAVLQPEESSFASLRLGMDEARLVAITLILYVLAIATTILGALGVAFLASLIQLVAGGSPGTAEMLLVVLGLALFAGLVFVVVRLSLVYPLVLVHRRIGLDASWELTRGHFWSLLGAYILMALISFALMLAIELPLAAAIAGEGMRIDSSHWNAIVAAAIRGDRSALNPGLIAAAIAGIAVNAIMLALWAGMAATGTCQLLDEQDQGTLEGEAY